MFRVKEQQRILRKAKMFPLVEPKQDRGGEKRLQLPSACEQMLWPTHAVEYYSALKEGNSNDC